MRQDRKTNKLVLFASILGIISGLLLMVGGAAGAVIGYLKPAKLIDITDLTFFITQEGIMEMQRLIFKDLLKIEFLYVFIGAIIAVVGLITLIISIININIAKKRKVANRRGTLLFLSLIYIVIAASVATYLVMEFNNITDNIKYVFYGISGVFGLIAILNILGIMVNRSEQFMSNDNNKYAFDNSSLRSARANVNNNVKAANVNRVDNQNVNRQQPVRPQPNMRPPQRTQSNMRPQQPGVRAPQGQRAPMQQPQRPQANQKAPTYIPRPQINDNAQSTARPVVSRSGAQAKVVGKAPSLLCNKCGTALNDGESVCSICGNKVIK